MAGFNNTPPASEFRRPTSWGRTRGIKNVVGSGSITTNAGAPTATDSTLGYATENQRYMHLAVNGFPGAADNNSAFTIWGYSHAMGRWGRLTRHGSGFQNIWINGDGNQHQLQHSQDSPQCTKYILEVAGIDRIYIQHGGSFDSTNDKVYLGFNTF
jgi:hypothetical protein